MNVATTQQGGCGQRYPRSAIPTHSKPHGQTFEETESELSYTPSSGSLLQQNIERDRIITNIKDQQKYQPVKTNDYQETPSISPNQKPRSSSRTCAVCLTGTISPPIRPLEKHYMNIEKCCKEIINVIKGHTQKTVKLYEHYIEDRLY